MKNQYYLVPATWIDTEMKGCQDIMKDKSVSDTLRAMAVSEKQILTHIITNCKMFKTFEEGEILKVKDEHKFHGGKVGKFAFMGGPERDVVVIRVEKNSNTENLICVGVDDVENNE